MKNILKTVAMAVGVWAAIILVSFATILTIIGFCGLLSYWGLA